MADSQRLVNAYLYKIEALEKRISNLEAQTKQLYKLLSQLDLRTNSMVRLGGS